MMTLVYILIIIVSLIAAVAIAGFWGALATAFLAFCIIALRTAYGP